MTAALLAAAFAVLPQPNVLPVVKPLDEVAVRRLMDFHGRPSRQSQEQLASLIASISRPDVARCGPIISLEVTRSEGGFMSGFGPAPPWALPKSGGGFWPPSGWIGEPLGYDRGGFGGWRSGQAKPGGGRGGLTSHGGGR
jgi:hypothetical protein